ncbi:MAG: RNA polymerase sigma factor [Defluviitaleaceae bacterium]|nr:RNA polymerase sigma factor [Defluviitaleaceae bacterium]
MMTDAQLLKQTNAFERIFVRYEKLIYHVCRRYFNNTEDAMDAGQEAALRLFRNLTKVVPKADGSIKSWVCTVTAHVCLDIVRKRRVETEELTDETRIATNITERPVEETITAKERVQEIAATIDSLPDDQRIIVIMRDLQGLRYDELAEILNISVGTVKSRLSRARAAIKKRLE